MLGQVIAEAQRQRDERDACGAGADDADVGAEALARKVPHGLDHPLSSTGVLPVVEASAGLRRGPYHAGVGADRWATHRLRRGPKPQTPHT